jgi:hypothetical protein
MIPSFLSFCIFSTSLTQSDTALIHPNNQKPMKSPTLQFNMMYISSYSDDDEDDDGSMSTGRTMSSISMPPMTNDSNFSPVPVPSSESSNIRSPSSLPMSFLQHAIESDAQTSIAKNTYFMDGGNRFISVSTLSFFGFEIPTHELYLRSFSVLDFMLLTWFD